MTVLEGGEEDIAEDFVAALGSRGERLEVVVVQWPDGGVIEDLPVGLIEDKVNGIGDSSIGQPLAGEDHAVAGEAGFEGALRAIGGGIAEFRGEEGGGILEKRLLDTRVPAPAYDHRQVSTNLGDAAQAEHFGQWPTQGMDALINHDGVEFICQVPGLAIRRVGRDLPVQLDLALGVFPGNFYLHPPLLREVVDGEP